MINKIQWSGVLLAVLLLFTACPAGTADSAPEPQEVRYIEESNPQSREETVLVAALYANLLITGWDTLEEIDPDSFFQFYEAMVVLGETQRLEGAYVPADIVEEVIAAHFGAEAVPLARTSLYYEFEGEENAYWVGGLGNVVRLTLDGVAQENGVTVISYSRYFDGQWQRSGELSVELEPEGGFRYRSHRVLT